MDSAPVERSGRVPVWYRIVVRGELTQRFTEPLENAVVESAGDESILHVQIIDQAKLYAILGWLFEHGVDLISLSPAVDANQGGASVN
jgi:hypothetical protein